MSKSERALREEALEKRGGACTKCPLRLGDFEVTFPATCRVLRITGDNAKVRVRCGAAGNELVKTIQVGEYRDCARYQKKGRHPSRSQQRLA